MLIYVSGPITLGATAHHVHDALRAAEYLIALGHNVMVPQLTHLWDVASPKPWVYWLKNDLALVKRCDALLRLPGESLGAEAETKAALENKIPVYTDLYEVPAAEGALD